MEGNVPMTQIYEAVYEHGIFRPVNPVAQEIPDGQHVRLVVETNTPEEILNLASEVYEGFLSQTLMRSNRSHLTARPSSRGRARDAARSRRYGHSSAIIARPT